MNFEKELLKTEEKVMLALRSIYHKYGYAPFKMSRFEEYIPTVLAYLEDTMK